MSKSRNFSMKEYFKRRVQDHDPRLRFGGKTVSDFEKWKKELLGELKRLLGPMPERVPLNPEVVYEVKEDGLIKRKVVFDSEKDMSVPALVYIPESAHTKPLPAILCSHGHGPFGKDSVMGIRSKLYSEQTAVIDRYNYDYGLKMAKHGYVTMAIDWRCFGERNDSWDPPKCDAYYVCGSLLGVNLLALDIFDGMCAIDYLSELECVDSSRIGAMGLSFGGTMTAWLSFMDERIKAADIICYSARFIEFAFDRINICGSQILPELFKICDVPDLHGLIAPKPLLVEIGAHDKCFLAEEALSCCREVEKIYKAADALEKLEVNIFDGGHEFSEKRVFDFFDKYLKG